MAPPYHPKGEKPPRRWKHKQVSILSLTALHREYESLGTEFEITQLNQNIFFYRHKHSKTIIGGYEDYNKQFDENGFVRVFILQFKSKNTIINLPKELNTQKIIQVSKVNTATDFERFGIAPFVYSSLVKAGFTIISDTTQLDGGVGLWKKMARQAHLNDYQIHVIDDEEGFRKDSNGNLLTYNSKNIDDAIIWTHDLDFSGQHKLLVMISK